MKLRWAIAGVLLTWPGGTRLYAQDSLRTTQLDNVVVTGQFEPSSIRQSVYQVRTISYAQIVRRGATNLQSVLATELGVRFTNDLALGVSDMKLMGMGGQNVKILLDGVPLLERGETREALNQIDINTVERIEIVEGPMSVMYGSDALAGVLNIITKKYDGRWNFEARVLEETAAKEYDPFTDKGVHNESVGAHWQGGKWSAGGSITRNNAGGWKEDHYPSDLPSQPMRWHPKDQWLGMGNVGFATGKLTLRYRLNYTDETITSFGTYNPRVGQAVDKEYITHRYNHQLQADWNLAERLVFNGVASYQDYSRRTRTLLYEVATGATWLSPEPGTQDETDFSMAMSRGTFLYRLSDRVSLQPGFDINLSKGAGDRIDREREINDYAVFAAAEIKPTSFLNIRPGVRFIYNTVYDAPPVVPSVNTKVQLSPRLDLRLAYAYGFRSPALRELYFSFHDASHDIYGNENLKAEYSNSFTGSLVWQALTGRKARLNSTLSGFYNTFKDQIILATVADPSAPSGMISRYENITKSRTFGTTLDNNYQYGGLQVSLGFSYIGVSDPLKSQEGTLELIWSPEVRTNVAYTWSKPGTTVSLYYKYTGKSSNYETVTPQGSTEPVTRLATRENFQWADFTVAQRVNSKLDLTAGVRNLLDVTTLRNTSLDVGNAHSGGGDMPMSYGRSYFLSLQFHLTK
jgi:outer membrane receptor for ferrienterochelin and colicins